MSDPRGRKPVTAVDTTPQPPLGKPRMPSGLDSIAKAEWKRVLPMLDAMGITSKIDGTILELYCRMYSRWQLAERTLAKEGFEKECANGYNQLNVWSGIGNNAIKTMRDCMDELGMTPKSRQKLKALPRPRPEAAKWNKLLKVAQ